ncbi:hypothetical protein BJV82DRAFT_314438 [Fennellomyces sp. T-0311]|nr:hypothetical protein BJV82DRAFT_314438 [Fennellomyces sp. T-0311]
MDYIKFQNYLKKKKNSVQLDTVVTVENCYYYMSLLEHFDELERTMLPDYNQFAHFLVVAEKRYLDFLRLSHTKNEWNHFKHVPIDIAYVWHAHLLSPYRYYEDVGCNV